MDLYHFPDVYNALRTPDNDLLARARHALDNLLDAKPASVMDPACGPANWLLPFARDGAFVAGNDLNPAMVEMARRQLQGRPHELVVGDMRDLRFRSAPFDVALEIAGTAGLLETSDDLARHLRSVGSCLRPGGVFLLTLLMLDHDAATSPGVTHEAGPIPVDIGGEAWVRYEVLRWRDGARICDMKRAVRTRDVPGCPDSLEDHYSLRHWDDREIHDVLARVPELDVASDDAFRSRHDREFHGERTFALRRR